MDILQMKIELTGVRGTLLVISSAVIAAFLFREVIKKS